MTSHNGTTAHILEDGRWNMIYSYTGLDILQCLLPRYEVSVLETYGRDRQSKMKYVQVQP